MPDNILVEILGDTPNIRMLGFFLENPFDEYNITQISRITNVAKDTVKKYIQIYMKNKMVICNGDKRKYYRINLKNSYVKRIEKDMFDFVGISVQSNEKTASCCSPCSPYNNFIQSEIYRPTNIVAGA